MPRNLLRRWVLAGCTDVRSLPHHRDPPPPQAWQGRLVTVSQQRAKRTNFQLWKNRWTLSFNFNININIINNNNNIIIIIIINNKSLWGQAAFKKISPSNLEAISTTNTRNHRGDIPPTSRADPSTSKSVLISPEGSLNERFVPG